MYIEVTSGGKDCHIHKTDKVISAAGGHVDGGTAATPFFIRVVTVLRSRVRVGNTGHTDYSRCSTTSGHNVIPQKQAPDPKTPDPPRLQTRDH